MKRYGSDVAPDLIYIAKYQISGSVDTAKMPNKEFDIDNPYQGKIVLMNGQALMLATLRSQLKIDPKRPFYKVSIIMRFGYCYYIVGV